MLDLRARFRPRSPSSVSVPSFAFLALTLLAALCVTACAGQGGDSTGTAGSGGTSPVGSGGSGGGTAGGSGGSGGSAAGGVGGGAGDSPDGSTGDSGGLPPEAIIVEDDFDSTAANGPADPGKWAAYPVGQTGSAPVVDTARFHSPPNSARVTSTSSGLGAFLVPAAGLPVSANAFYVRVFINWEKATADISGHSGFIVGSAARDESATELRLGISSKGPGGTPRMDLNLQNPSDGGEVTRYSNGFTDGGDPGQYTGTGFQFASDTWYCLEAFFSGTPSASEFQVWVDGAEIPEMHVTDFRGSPGAAPRTAWAPTYNFIKIGANDYDANLGRIWYDDVVVATSRVGCN